MSLWISWGGYLGTGRSCLHGPGLAVKEEQERVSQVVILGVTHDSPNTKRLKIPCVVLRNFGKKNRK